MSKDGICLLLDAIPKGQGRPKVLICYANGRLLGQQYLTDYCLQGSNLGHQACPILAAGDNAAYVAWEHYNRLKK